MQTYIDPTSLADRLVSIFESDHIALFAGAGVSARAGLPVWHSYLHKLADVAAEFEPLVADLIRKRIAANLLLQAADAYTGCVEIPTVFDWRA